MTAEQAERALELLEAIAAKLNVDVLSLLSALIQINYVLMALCGVLFAAGLVYFLLLMFRK